MQISGLLEEISERSHLEPYSKYESNIQNALRQAINELVYQVPTSDINYLIKSTTIGVTTGKISLPAKFSRLLKTRLIEITSQRISTRFVLTDYDHWQWLGVDPDYDPPPNTVYYIFNGSDILYYKSTSVNGKSITIDYIESFDITAALNEELELTDDGDFSFKFIDMAKNRSVEILTAEMRREQ